MPPPADGWPTLTWNDLQHWTGVRSVERGRTYQRGGRVKKLGISAAGELLAWVQGTTRYATAVSLRVKKAGPELTSSCSCPVGANCKHAVAVVAEYLDAAANGRAVPAVTEDDPRWEELDAEADEYRDEYDDSEEEYDDEQDAPPPRPAKGKPKAKTADADIAAYLRGLSHTELADMMVSLVGRFPELRQEFRDRLALLSGDVARLVKEARKEIQQATAPPTYNRWDDYGSGIPDYRPIRHRLERLLELGHPDEVAALGRVFLSEGQQRLEYSDDEGETISAFGEVVPVIFRAVAASGLTGAEKLLFAIDAVLGDDFDAVGESADDLLAAEYTKAEWSVVADELAERLKGKVTEDSRYHRDRISSWVGKAMANAGRGAEVDELFEAEAKATGSYERLVKHLISRKRLTEAEEWAATGIAATAAQWPGVASHLAADLRDLAADRKEWDVVAAHSALAFFDRPSAHVFEELIAAARKTKVEAEVRAAAVAFLETGTAPYRLATGKPAAKKPTAAVRKAGGRERAVPASGVDISADWPLPVPAYLEPMLHKRAGFVDQSGPHFDVLLDMAMKAKRPDEVLKWYDRMRAAPKQSGTYYGARGYADEVAKAVADTHPQRALDIYTAALNAELPNASPSAYEAAAGYLKKLKPIYATLGRAEEWAALVAGIREKYRNRPKFMDILDRMEGRDRPIVQGARRKKK